MDKQLHDKRIRELVIIMVGHEMDTEVILPEDLREWAIAVVKEYQRKLDDFSDIGYDTLEQANTERYFYENLIDFLIDRFEIKESEP